MAQRIVGRRDPMLWSLLPLIGALLILVALSALILWGNWPR